MDQQYNVLGLIFNLLIFAVQALQLLFSNHLDRERDHDKRCTGVAATSFSTSISITATTGPAIANAANCKEFLYRLLDGSSYY